MEPKTKKTARKKAGSKIDNKKPVKRPEPTTDQIKARAYEIYVESGCQGTELENWLKAEQELK